MNYEDSSIYQALRSLQEPSIVSLLQSQMERTKQEPHISKMGKCTCELCQSMAGKPIEEKAPPYHEGCSCESVPAPMERAAKQEVPESELIGGQPRLEYNAKLDIWEAADTEEQLAQLRSKGEYIRWDDHPSATGVCAVCGQNVGVVRRIGEPFPSKHRLPQAHGNCQCSVTVV